MRQPLAECDDVFDSRLMRCRGEHRPEMQAIGSGRRAVIGSLHSPHGRAHVGDGILITDKQFRTGGFKPPGSLVVASDESADRKSLLEQLQRSWQACFSGGAGYENSRFSAHANLSCVTSWTCVFSPRG